MASISNLSVIISGVTSPLSKALKTAEKEVAAFKTSKSITSGIKQGLGLGLGVMGLDSMEKAVKKYIQSNEPLNAAAEKMETSFGKALVHLSGMDRWLPGLANKMEEIANWAEHGSQANMVSANELKKAAEWAKEYHATNERAAERAKSEKFRSELTALAGSDEQKSLLKELEARAKALDPEWEMREIAKRRMDAPNSLAQIEIDSKLKQIEQLQKAKEATEKQTAIMEDMKKLEEELYSMEYGSLAAERAALIAKGADTATMAQFEAIQERMQELEFLKALDETVLGEAANLAGGNVSDKLASRERRFAGAVSGADAYSAIMGNDSAPERSLASIDKRQAEVAIAAKESNKQLSAVVEETRKVREAIGPGLKLARLGI